MQQYYQGDFLLADIYYTDLSGSKTRPVIIVSKNSMNKGEDFLVAKVTSNLKPHYSTVFIDNNKVDFNLNKNSEVRCGEIMTLHKTFIIKRLGRIRDKGLKAVLEKVQDSFIKE